MKNFNKNLFNEYDDSNGVFDIAENIKTLFEEEFLDLLQEYKRKGGNKISELYR